MQVSLPGAPESLPMLPDWNLPHHGAPGTRVVHFLYSTFLVERTFDHLCLSYLSPTVLEAPKGRATPFSSVHHTPNQPTAPEHSASHGEGTPLRLGNRIKVGHRASHLMSLLPATLLTAPCAQV